MNLYIDSPYNINLYKKVAKTIVLPDSLQEKIKKLLPKIERTHDFLKTNKNTASKTAAIFIISPEEDIYLHEGWTIRMIVTKRPPQKANLDYRERDGILYIAYSWRPNFNDIYHEIVHAIDPKARQGIKAI